MEQVQERIAGLDMEVQRKMVCALIGHTRLLNGCFGYHHCARCGELVGDSLGGAFSAPTQVVIGCKCNDCRERFLSFDWKDTFMVDEKELVRARKCLGIRKHRTKAA